MKILFLQTRFNRNPWNVFNSNDCAPFYDFVFPLGMPYISAVLKRNGYHPSVLNLNFTVGRYDDVIREHMSGNRYDVVFLGGTSIYYPNIREAIKVIRECSPKTKIVVGGGLISSQPEVMLELLKPDYGVIGEGEQTCLELVKNLNNTEACNKTPGLVVWKDGKPFVTARRAGIRDLDLLPFPDLESFGLMEHLDNQTPWYMIYQAFDKPRAYPIISARGCTAKCTFCFHTTGNHYAMRTIDNVIAEMEYAVKKYNVNLFLFLDELFAFNKARVMEFCRKFKKLQKTIPYEVVVFFNLRCDIIDEEIIDAIKELNPRNCVGFGVESYNINVLKSMRKHITPDQINNAFKITSDRHITTQCNVIFGDSAETMDTAKDTLDFYTHNMDILRGGLNMTFISVFPGTELYHDCKTRGIIKDDVQFIEERANAKADLIIRPLNMTHMSDECFGRLVSMVYNTEYYKGNHFVKPLSVKTTDGVTEVQIRCPDCGEITTLKNERIPSDDYWAKMVLCRNGKCNLRFFMSSPKHALARKMYLVLGERLFNIVTDIFTKIRGKK